MIKNKEELITRIFYIILFVGLLIVIARAKTECNDYTDEKTIGISNMFDRIGELEGEISNLNSDLELNKRDTYDLWWATLSEDSFNEIKSWEKENPNFMTCDKDIIKFDIRSSFFSKDTAHAKSFVWILETGHVVYDREGNVNCYPKETPEEEPEPIECIELCRTTEAKETNEIL